MATTAQVLANQANARLSTGPATDAGKAAVAQNATSHGLSSVTFTLLPHENAEDFAKLLETLNQEFSPGCSAEDFLVTEMARAQWKLRRVDAIESAILAGAVTESADPWAAIAAQFQSLTGDALVKLDRYATSARRAWHKSLDTLLKFRAAEEISGVRTSRIERNLSEAAINRVISAPIPCTDLPPIPMPRTNYETKPMPSHLERELNAHKRRDPLFDPRLDASQMSKELRKWYAAA